jgi:hypothetical protein
MKYLKLEMANGGFQKCDAIGRWLPSTKLYSTPEYHVLNIHSHEIFTFHSYESACTHGTEETF